MDKIKRLKIRTGVQTALSHLVYYFNRRVKGVRARYNLNYCGDKVKWHTLDVMSVKGASGLPCVIYLHGGGWTAYDKSLFRTTCKRLSSYGTTVFNCNFSQAPKFGIEDMVADVDRIIAYVRANAEKYGGDPTRLIFAGDSAGAHLLALKLGRTVRDSGTTGGVIGCAFFYGVYDLTALRGIKFKNLDAYLAATLPDTGEGYDKLLADESPVNFVDGRFPPTLLCSGMTDTLHEGQSAKYAQALKAAGVRTECLFFPPEFKKARHKYITFATNPAAKISFEAFGKFLNGIC